MVPGTRYLLGLKSRQQTELNFSLSLNTSFFSPLILLVAPLMVSFTTSLATDMTCSDAMAPPLLLHARKEDTRTREERPHADVYRGTCLCVAAGEELISRAPPSNWASVPDACYRPAPTATARPGDKTGDGRKEDAQRSDLFGNEKGQEFPQIGHISWNVGDSPKSSTPRRHSHLPTLSLRSEISIKGI